MKRMEDGEEWGEKKGELKGRRWRGDGHAASGRTTKVAMMSWKRRLKKRKKGTKNRKNTKLREKTKDSDCKEEKKKNKGRIDEEIENKR